MIAVPIANNSVPMLHEIVWLPGEWYITAFLIAGMIAFGVHTSVRVGMGIASLKEAFLLSVDGVALLILSYAIIEYNKFSRSSLYLFLPITTLAFIYMFVFIWSPDYLEGKKKHE